MEEIISIQEDFWSLKYSSNRGTEVTTLPGAEILIQNDQSIKEDSKYQPVED
jgi:hypothetical protein